MNDPRTFCDRATAPLAIFIGEKDDMSTATDGATLAAKLPNVFHFELLDYPNCSHLDFAIGIDAGRIIYEPIMKMMAEFMRP
jgi:pimeloyl-ACP methyl ester carboxylesterase